MYSNLQAVILENVLNVLADIYQSICNSHTIYFRCYLNWSYTEPKDYSNCVDGRVVESFGVPYDFDSMMHYSIYS